jgi:hypothetical protein
MIFLRRLRTRGWPKARSIGKSFDYVAEEFDLAFV